MTEFNVASVDSALRLLNLLAENPGLGLSAIARKSGLTKSRTYRLLCTLENQFFVQRSGEPVTYRLGHQLLVLGVNARRQINLTEIAEPVLDQLSQQLNENLQIRLREGNEIVQIAVRTSRQVLQVRSAVGNRRKLGAGASGKLLLAYAPETLRDEFVQQSAQPESLRALLAEINQQQLCCSQGELTAGVWAFAVPVFDNHNHCVASLSLSAPASRAEQHRQLVIEALHRAAAQISHQLGSPAYGALPLAPLLASYHDNKAEIDG